MYKISLILVVFLLIGFAGCKSSKTAASGDSGKVLDYKSLTGVYSGFLPCADCEKISYKLRFNQDSTYACRMVYVGKSATPFNEHGKFSIRNDGVLILEKKGPGFKYFKWHPQGLLMLDAEGKRIKGATADRYILTGMPTGEAGEGTNASAIEEVHNPAMDPDPKLGGNWVVEKVKGSALIAGDYARGVPALEFVVKEQRVGGHDGCNSIGGTFTATTNTITFSNISGTKMACPGKDQGVNIGLLLSGQAYHYQFIKSRLVFTQEGNDLGELIVFKRVK
ncbi:MAG: copper resistance protein NlpE N-terminal domain-containing protein [Bacteroidales bacterium]